MPAQRHALEPLGQQIRKLEEILGYPLFLRTSRAVKLTSAGEVFLERARRTLRSVQEDMDEARSIGRSTARTRSGSWEISSATPAALGNG